MGRATKKPATPGAALYLRDHSLTPRIRPTNVMRVFFAAVELMGHCRAPQVRTQIEEAQWSAFLVHRADLQTKKVERSA